MTLEIGAPMPSLDGATEWLNATGAHAAHESQGHPTLVHFWSASCGVCEETLPRVAGWRERFGARGLRFVAVHVPRSEADEDAEQVRDAVTQYDISEPCAVDNGHKLRDAFRHEQDDVPAYYLFDAEGKLRSFAAGVRGFTEIVAEMERLLPHAEEQSGS
jgi:thiol-disulfide isomerase/thioredoxin